MRKRILLSLVQYMLTLMTWLNTALYDISALLLSFFFSAAWIDFLGLYLYPICGGSLTENIPLYFDPFCFSRYYLKAAPFR